MPVQNRKKEFRTVRANELKPHPLNWRKHPERQRSALANVLEEVGDIAVLKVVESDGELLLIDGHLRASIREADDVEVVVVDLDENEQKLVLATFDPLGALAQKDDQTYKDLSALVETENEVLQELMKSVDTPSMMRSTPTDAIPTDPLENIAKIGDLFMLDGHRVFCGDSTNSADVEKLMDGVRADCVLTDPPYAIYGSSSGLSSSVTDDKIVRPFFRDVLHAAQRTVKMFGQVYVFCDWRSWPSWWEVSKTTQLAPKNLLVWYKGGGMGNNYANAYELVGYYVHMPEQRTMSSDRVSGIRPVLKPNVIMGSGRPAGGTRTHNAQKPVTLLSELIENGTEEGEIVLDYFLGSGSTLIAAEQQNRICYAMEIDPKYVDLSIARWEQMTGKKAIKVEQEETDDEAELEYFKQGFPVVDEEDELAAASNPNRCQYRYENGTICASEKGYAGDGLCYDHSNGKE